jgi:hypothetical protein
MSVVKDVEIMLQGMIFKFQIKLIVQVQNPPPPPLDKTIEELKMVFHNMYNGENYERDPPLKSYNVLLKSND